MLRAVKFKKVYRKPSLFVFLREKAYLCCIKIDNSLTNHTFLVKTLAFYWEMIYA